MDFDIELREICEKYGIMIRCIEESIRIFLDTFKEVWDSISFDEPIAFYGLGKGYEYMSESVDLSSKNVVCIFENRIDSPYQNSKTPIVPIESINAYKFNKVILTGFGSRNQMKQDISNYNLNIDVIDIYDILINKGYIYNKPFFEVSKPTYESLEMVRLKYRASSTTGEAQKNLRLLIQEYLNARDFLCADLYIQEYIDNMYDDADSLKNLRYELKSMIARIKNIIKERTNKNIFIFVLDSLSYRQAKKIPFLNEFSKNGLSFSNAYSSAFHTRASTLSYLTGKRLLEDDLYKLKTMSLDDSEFLLEMQTLGIKVKHISSAYFSFAKPLKDSEKYTVNEVIMPLLYWSLLMNVVRESGECIYFIHSIYETHLPFHSGNPSVVLLDKPDFYKYFDNPSETSAEIVKQIYTLVDEAYKYAESQLEYIIGLLDLDKDTVIITSDHKEATILPLLKGIPNTSDMHRIPLIIHSKHVTPGIYDGLYSAINMTKLLRHFIYGKEVLNIPELEYAVTEMEPIYHMTAEMKERLETLVASGKGWVFGVICITTNSEQYLFNLNGNEHFYLLSDLDTDLIDNEQYVERINYFRSKIEIDTRDIWRWMFEKYPYLLEVHKEKAYEFLNENKVPLST